MTDLITQYLYNGDFLGFFAAFYTEAMGGIFWGFLIYMVITPLYMQTENIGYVIVAILLLSSGIVALVPISAYGIVGLFLALGIGGIMTLVYTRYR